MSNPVSVILIFCYLLIRTTTACGNFQVKVQKVANCEGYEDSIIQLENVKSFVTKDCLLQLTGCFTSTKTFSSAQVKYVATRNLLFKIPGHFDLCSNSRLCSFIPSGRLCIGNGTEIDLSKYRKMLRLLIGKTKVVLDIEQDTGKTCIMLDIIVKLNAPVIG